MSDVYGSYVAALKDNIKDLESDAKYFEKRIKELEAENARLRQQRDAANAQLDFILENMKEEKAP